MIAAFLASATASKAADYTIDPTHSHVLFTIDHLGFAKMVGLFSDFSGNISFDANNGPASKLNVTIKTDSLQTQFAPRDKDLKGADWFNVTEFPEMTFVGSEFAKKDDHTGTVTGKLTLHGVTKPITLTLKGGRTAEFPRGVQRTGYVTEFSIKRSDFGMDKMVGAVGNKITVEFSFEGTKQ